MEERSAACPRTPRSGSGAQAVVVLVAVCSLLAGPGSVAEGPGCGEEAGAFVRIPAPRFPKHEDSTGEITAYARDPVEPERLYVTDGVSVLRSVDGGCTWEEGLRPEGRDPARILSISVPPSEEAHHGVFLLVEGSRELGRVPVAQTRIVVSDRFGEHGSYRQRPGTGLPPAAAEPVLLRVSPSDPERLYLVVEVGLGSEALYASGDGGGSWEARSLPEPPSSLASVEALEVSPGDADGLWAIQGGELHRSEDGGASWDEVELPDGSDTPVGLALAEGGRGAQVRVALGSEAVTGLLRADGGGAFEHRPIDPPLGLFDSMAHDVRSGVTVVATREEGGVHLLGPSGEAVRVGASGIGRLADVTVDTGEPATFAFRRPAEDLSRSSLVLLRPEVVGPDHVGSEAAGPGADAPGGGGPGSLEPSPSAPPEPEPPVPARIEGAPIEVDLPAGGSATRRIRLVLPPMPRPSDLFFLVDASGSTISERRAFARDLGFAFDGIAARGIDARYGVGNFTDYPFAPWGSPSDDAYRRGVAVGADGEAVRSALVERYGVMGTRFASSSLTGLFQGATGAGQENTNPSGEPDASIPPGLDAGFDDGRRRLVVHLADVPFHEGPGYPGPSFDRTSEELVDRGVLQLGVALEGGEDPLLARVDLERMAASTGARATSGGADCDGDGAADLRAGDPLVCSAPGVGVADAVVGLVAAAPDHDDAWISDEHPLLSVSPPRYRRLDRGVGHELAFTLSLRCPARGGEHRIPLVARWGADVVSRSEAALSCGPAGAAAAGPEAEPGPGFPPGESGPVPVPAGSAAQAPAPAEAPGQAGAPAGAGSPVGAQAQTGAVQGAQGAAVAPEPGRVPAPERARDRRGRLEAGGNSAAPVAVTTGAGLLTAGAFGALAHRRRFGIATRRLR